jgi:hypothetical protein
MLSIGLWRWYINITITIVDIIHRPVFYLKRSSTLQVCPYLTGNTLRLRYEPKQVNAIYRFVMMVHWYNWAQVSRLLLEGGDRIQFAKRCFKLKKTGRLINYKTLQSYELSNHKTKPSFATISKLCFISCSLWSQHVSAFAWGHLQVITM